MSNIYEALEQAQLDKNRTNAKEIVPLPKNIPGEKVRLRDEPEGQTSPNMKVPGMASLYRTVELLLPEHAQKTIQFIGYQPGVGVSTVVREIAKLSANMFGKKVLVLDAAHHNPTQHHYYNVKRSSNESAQSQDGQIFEKHCHQTGEANLCVASFPGSAPHSYFVDAKSSLAFLDDLEKRFDLIFIDSSPLTVAPDSVALSRHVNGVILVVEAEKTKWCNAMKLREKVLNSGGNILGIVFNKRHYHIPESVYNWLF